MIGEHPLEVGNPCNICLAPYSRPSILNDIIQYFTRKIADHPKGKAINGTQMQMRYRIVPYSGGSDHGVFVARPICIPGIMIGHEDPYWHSSLDTIEKCDSTELKRVIAIALCTCYIFSIQNKNTLISVWPITELYFYQRLGKVKELIYSLYSKLNPEIETSLLSKNEIVLIGEALIGAFVKHEESILDSIKKFDSLLPITKELYDEKVKELEIIRNELLSSWNRLCKYKSIDLNVIEEPDYLKQKWVLKFIGRKNLKYYIPLLLSSEYEKFKVPEPPDVWGGDAQEMLNFIGLSLNLKEICAILTLEFHHYFPPQTVFEFAELFEQYGFLEKAN